MNVSKFIGPLILPAILMVVLLYAELTATQQAVIALVLIGYAGAWAGFVMLRRSCWMQIPSSAPENKQLAGAH